MSRRDGLSAVELVLLSEISTPRSRALARAGRPRSGRLAGPASWRPREGPGAQVAGPAGDLPFGALRGQGWDRSARVERRAPVQLGPRKQAAYFEAVWGDHACGHRHTSHVRASRCLQYLLGVGGKP